MKTSIRNLWFLIGVLALLAAEVSLADTSPTLAAGMIGKVTYLLGQAEMTTADGTVLPLSRNLEIPDGSRITVKERSRVSLLMVDGGVEKLGANTVFTFNKYTYDPANPAATEIRKTLLDGEVTSTTGRGGEDAKERYRLNSPLAAIAVLGTEYTVKVSKGETWVTVLSGEISIAKLGGSCQRSGLGACVGGERLSEGQRGLAFVVRASEPKPVLMPVTAIPVSEKPAEKPAETPQASAKEAEKESAKKAANEPEKSQQAASTEKPAAPEPPNSTQVTTATASTAQQNSTKPPDNSSSAAAPPVPASESSAAAAAPSPVVEQVPAPKAVEKANLPVANTYSAPVTEKPPASVVVKAEPNPSAKTVITAQAPISVEFVAVTTPERTQALPSVALESKASALTVSTVSSTPQAETSVASNTKPTQSLVQSSNNFVVPLAPDKEKVSVTPAVITTPAVTAAPAKPSVTPVVTVTPVVKPSVEEKPKVETVAEPVPVISTVTPPVVVSEPPAPIVNWGKYDPTASVDGKTSFSDQVSNSYTQLLQPVSATPAVSVPQQTPSVSLPEPDKPDVGVYKGDDTVAADPVAVVSPSATPQPAAPVTVTAPSLPAAPVTVTAPSLPAALVTVTVTAPSLPAESVTAPSLPAGSRVSAYKF